MDVVIQKNGKQGKDHNSKGGGGQKKEAQKKRQGHNLTVKFYRSKGKQKQVKQNIEGKKWMYQVNFNKLVVSKSNLTLMTLAKACVL